MTDIVEDPIGKSLQQETLESILCELRKLNYLLQDVHETEVHDEDIEDECN